MASPIAPSPARATTADQLCGATDNPCVVNRVVQVDDGSIIDVGSRELRIADGGILDVRSGNMTLLAGTLTVQPQGMLLANGSTTMRGGVVEVTADNIAIQGTIGVAGAPGGRVELTARAEVAMTGSINGSSLSGGDSGGDIILTGATVDVGGPILATGGSSAEEGPLGGTITVQASGDVSVSSTLDVSGSEGGFLELFSGVLTPGGGGGPTAGNVTVASSARILADSNTAGGAGGDIEIDATGDGVATGHVAIGGLVSAIGRSGSFDTGGGEGGAMDISAIGDVRLEDGATIDARGGGPDGCGGMIDVTTTNGGLNTAAEILIRSAGSDSEGGTFTADINANVDIRGPIDATAGSGGGGEISIDSFLGAATITDDLNVDATAGESGPGGTISVGTFDEPVAVIVRGALSANGGGVGAGGTIELLGKESVQVNARLTANSGSEGGRGGTLFLSAAQGSVMIDARLDAVGNAANSSGGIVSVDAQAGITVLQQIDVHAQGGSGRFCRLIGNACQNDDDCSQGDNCVTAGGGKVDFTSTGPVDVLANVVANSTAGGGGRVDIVSEGDVTISGNTTTDGSREPGGVVEALGCSVVVCGLDARPCPAGGVGVISSLGPAGTNRLRGRGRVGVNEAVVTVLGMMRADQAGGNFLVWSGTPAAFRPAVILPQNVTPAAREQVDATLLPCPVCGNNAEELPETCDDGNQEDGDGCSSICQIEADIVLGDVNGDLAVNDADVCDLITEIFDGDGDSVGSVATRAPRSRPGADANEDRRINAADILETIRLRGTPSEACAPCLGRLGLCQ
jgi:cysteine-rich repeat protein